MTEQEIFNNETKIRLSVYDEKFDAFIREMKDFKDEMRQQNQMRAVEITELRQKQDAMQATHDAEMKELNEKIDSKFDKLSSQIQNMAIAAVVGVGAVVVGVVSVLR